MEIINETTIAVIFFIFGYSFHSFRYFFCRKSHKIKDEEYKSIDQLFEKILDKAKGELTKKQIKNLRKNVTFKEDNTNPGK